MPVRNFKLASVHFGPLENILHSVLNPFSPSTEPLPQLYESPQPKYIYISPHSLSLKRSINAGFENIMAERKVINSQQ